jgi:hypothetical protein
MTRAEFIAAVQQLDYVAGGLMAALKALAAVGLIARTGSGTAAARTLAVSGQGLSIANADGVAGNPTFAPANDLAALEALGTTGVAKRTGSEAWSLLTAAGLRQEALLTENKIQGACGTPQAIDVTIWTTVLDAPTVGDGSGTCVLTLAAGTYSGQTKVLLGDFTAGVPKYQIQGATTALFRWTTITIDLDHSEAVLVWDHYNAKWHLAAGTAVAA